MSTDLSGRKILVTGAAQGLGLGIARALARAGARLALVDQNRTVLHHLNDPLFSKSADGLMRDLAEPDAPSCVMGWAIAQLGAVNGLVNCAAWSFHKPFCETSVAEFDRVSAINERAPFFLTQEFVKTLPSGTQDPCVVNIASVNACVGNSNLTAYAATKGALLAMGRAMAVELAPKGIRVVTISPGSVRTTYSEHLISKGELAVDALLSRNLIKRFTTVEEVAELIVFLFGPTALSIASCIGLSTAATQLNENFGHCSRITQPRITCNKMPISLSAIDWFVCLTVLSSSIFLGLYIAIRKKSSEDSAHFFLADRSLLWPLVGASMYATNIGAEHLVGLSGDGYRQDSRWAL